MHDHKSNLFNLWTKLPIEFIGTFLNECENLELQTNYPFIKQSNPLSFHFINIMLCFSFGFKRSVQSQVLTQVCVVYSFQSIHYFV